MKKNNGVGVWSSLLFGAASRAKAFAAWMASWRPSRWAGAAALAGAVALAAAIGLQHAMGLDPCPLCIFQRVAVLGASLSFLAASAALGKGRVWGKIFVGVGIALSVGGLAVSVQHMHVMWFPHDVSCGPDLEYLMEAFPPAKWLPQVFAGEAECSAAARQLVLGLPIPVWSALLFAAQTALGARAWAQRVAAA